MTYNVKEHLELFINPVFNGQSSPDQAHLMFRVLGRQEPSLGLLLVYVYVISSFHDLEVHVMW